MKKLKIIGAITVISVMILSMMSISLSYTVEIDPDGLISLPWIITDGKGEITVDESMSSYQLYYQSVEISDTTYAELEKTVEEQKQFNETEKQKLEVLEEKVKNLQDQYNQIEDKELEEAKDLYAQIEQARKEYDDAYDLYVETFDSYTQKIKQLIPSFVEEKWIETKDRSFNLNLSEFSGKKNFVVWVKLIESGNTIYDQQIYTVNGSKVEEERIWSDFSNAYVSHVDMAGSTSDISQNKSKITLSGIKSDASIYHQFYFYFTNDSADIPEVNSEKWVMMPYTLSGESGIVNCDIELDMLAEFPYELDWDKDVYVVVYEVVSDEKIATNTITGEYKLVCSDKTLQSMLNLKPEEKPDNTVTDGNNTTADTTYPAAGISLVTISIISIIVMLGVYGYIRYRKYGNDI